ncbi:MAG: DUF1573 domain-containing protein [Gemmataceae bacterium]|nr:DUF1573 domain-containing protein [Gemmataceae bacterium]
MQRFEFPPVLREHHTQFLCNIPVENHTSERISIIEIFRSCGCTHAKLDKHEIDVGESTQLRLAVNIGGRTGAQKFTVRLLDKSGRARSYTAETYIHEPAAFSPDDDLSFGMVDPNARAEKVVNFDLCGVAESDLSGEVRVGVEGQGVSASVGMPAVDRLSPELVRGRRPVYLRLTAGSEPGPHSATVVMGYGPDGRRNESRTAVTWHVRPLIGVVPPLVFLSRTEPDGQELTREVVMSRLDGQPLSIVGVSAPDPLRVEVRSGLTVGEQRLIVRAKAVELIRSFTGQLRVTTNHPIQPVVVVQVAAVIAR